MNTYIALLRGINVGGKNKIKMADLKLDFERIGFADVQTYIQSGNVLFRCADGEKSIGKKIEQEIEKTHGMTISVVLRTAAQFGKIIENYPFSEEDVASSRLATDAEIQYVALLSDVPLPESIERFDAYKREGEDYRIIDREVYLLFRKSIRESKLATNLHRLGVENTVRNWRTVNKLYEMAQESG